jgi:molybdopterin/thiamine biosynthesis adenylyltransferase
MATSPPSTPSAGSSASDALVRERLRQGRVLIVGVGGLGTPSALWLARAGIGTLGLLDGDVVEPSNLPRQILYRSADIGRRKASAAAACIGAVHPTVNIEVFDRRLHPRNAVEMVRGFDFVIDATDGTAAKYLVNDAAVLAGVPFTHAGVVGFQGQVFTVLPRRSACLRCLFPSPPVDAEVPTCLEAGVIGPLAGAIGILQAAEAVKHIAGAGAVLANRLLTCDAGSGRWRTVRLAANPSCPLCGERPRIRTVELADGVDCGAVAAPKS